MLAVTADTAVQDSYPVVSCTNVATKPKQLWLTMQLLHMHAWPAEAADDLSRQQPLLELSPNGVMQHQQIVHSTL